jgi:para-nitrobenzyl esterase
VRGGKFKACHCLEIPFVFQNLEAMSAMVGTGAELKPLAERISGAWAAFARSGNPNDKGLPNWPATSTSARPTMVLNLMSEVIDNPDGAERAAVAAAAKAPPPA